MWVGLWMICVLSTGECAVIQENKPNFFLNKEACLESTFNKAVELQMNFDVKGIPSKVTFKCDERKGT
jgi:hypothetical protein